MQHVTAQNDELLMTSETARELGISQGTVLLWERTGKLVAIKTTNGRRLFRRSEVDRVKREREVERA